jgi:hypothetical protein
MPEACRINDLDMAKAQQFCTAFEYDSRIGFVLINAINAPLPAKAQVHFPSSSG